MHTHQSLSKLIGISIFTAALSACSGGSGFAPKPAAPTVRTGIHVLPLGQTAPYTVVELKTLGGTFAAGSSINDEGWISGLSGNAGNAVFHAALWRNRTAVDLGTLGGPNSAVEWPNHDLGLVVGISQTSRVDPLGEHWSCSAFIPYTGNTCRGFVWRSGVMNKLSTFGGNNGYATAANAHGEVVGWAENKLHDSTCVAPQVLQFEAAAWDSSGQIRVLPPFSKDLDGAATAVNDAGDVAGISGICQNSVGDLSAKHAVLWHRGFTIDIGNLGGSAWNTPAAINSSGEVVGFSDLRGDQHGANPNFHGFLWTRNDGIHDLGVLPGDVISEALGVNDKGQIVGISCATSNCSASRAFIYQYGVMKDLNKLVPPGSPLLVFANDINSHGEITGLAQDRATGAASAFRMTPRIGGDMDGSYSNPDASHPVYSGKPVVRFGPWGRVVPQL